MIKKLAQIIKLSKQPDNEKMTNEEWENWWANRKREKREIFFTAPATVIKDKDTAYIFARNHYHDKFSAGTKFAEEREKQKNLGGATVEIIANVLTEFAKEEKSWTWEDLRNGITTDAVKKYWANSQYYGDVLPASEKIEWIKSFVKDTLADPVLEIDNIDYFMNEVEKFEKNRCKRK